MAAKLVPAEPEVVRAYEAAAMGSLEMVGRACALEGYTPIKNIPHFDATEFVAFASPDSTWHVTKKFLDGAKHSILIGIYDFTADYVKTTLEKAMRRGVRVALMLDLDGRTGEQQIYDDLAKHGCDCVPAPSCASDSAHYFASSHEKVIVIDGEWTFVQSGNYTDNSIPQNEGDGTATKTDFVPGNRDMGVAVKSKAMAAFFTKLLRADMKLETDAEKAVRGLGKKPAVELLEAAPSQMPPLVPSKTFKLGTAVQIEPILSPDNYMKRISEWLKTAKKSIYIEEQYIRTAQTDIGTLLQAIADTVDANGIEVRIVLAQPFSCGSDKCKKAFDKAKAEMQALGKDYGLKIGTNVRILNPNQFVHCHNKLIVVDQQSVLISSQNWSDSAVSKNREAGLILHSPALAAYYADIFNTDWESALKKVALVNKPKYGPEALGTGKVVPLSWGDYAEV